MLLPSCAVFNPSANVRPASIVSRIMFVVELKIPLERARSHAVGLAEE